MSPTISTAASSGIASTSACVTMTASIEASSTTSRSQGYGAKGRARRQVLCQAEATLDQGRKHEAITPAIEMDRNALKKRGGAEARWNKHNAA
jgi:hypothetical protein